VRRLIIAFVLTALTGVVPAAAQDYPTRPITLIVPFSAGGPTDTLARIISDRMKTSLGQTVVIETVTGAGATIGVARAARAAPDGYTLLIGNWTSQVGGSAIYPVQYDILADLEPVARLPVSLLMIVGKPALPAANGKDLITWLKANPGRAAMATVGAGSAAHMCGLNFEQKTGAHLQFVPYRGAAPAIQDLVAGQIDLFCGDASNVLPFARNGSIRAYAVMNQVRWYNAPDIPTMDEVGVPGLYIPFWNGLWVPKGTPKEIIAKLNAAVVDTIGDRPTRKRLTELGLEIPTREELTPEALRAYHKAQTDKWWPFIKAAGIKAE
jgi:tripartite-type tricarboxylate transporter receptor subunit TctC